MRRSMKERMTRETRVRISMDLDGMGRVQVESDVAFMNHLIQALATHSLIDVEVTATGDLKHHVMEDTAICLGEALSEALGDRTGIRRFGYAVVPMDDALAYAAIDLAKRPYVAVDLKLDNEQVEDVAREDIDHFIRSLAMAIEANIHVRVLYGVDDHHKVEAVVKALALSIRQAIEQDPRRIGPPSSKGVM